MKRILTVSVILAMLISLTACEKTDENSNTETTTAITIEEVTAPEETTAMTTEEVTTTPEETTTTAEETTVATAETNVAVTTAETTVAKTTAEQKEGPRTERTDDEKNGVYYIKEYDDKGRVISAYSYRMKDDSLVTYYTKKYDSNNGYEMKVYDGDKKLVSHEFRDAKDNIVRMNILSTNGYALYKRNDKGRLIKEEYYNENGSLISYWTYTPDENSKTVKAEYYDVAGAFTYYYSGTINERGQYSLQKKYSADGTLLEDVTSGGVFS